jgi:hypothetical protein
MSNKKGHHPIANDGLLSARCSRHHPLRSLERKMTPTRKLARMLNPLEWLGWLEVKLIILTHL